MIRISFFYIDDGLLKGNHITNNIKTESRGNNKDKPKENSKKRKKQLAINKTNK